MVYTIPEMMSGQWLEGKVLTRDNYNDKFIGQLADLMVDIHGIVTQSPRIPKMQGIVDGLEQWDNFTKQAVTEYYGVRSKLQHTSYLHGDIWSENVIVDDDGNLVGLIDWEHADVGDPHWDFRMIRRWLGWDGLEELLFLYNANTGLQCKREYIEVLDKISLCNSRQIRSFTDPLFNEYIKLWPSIPPQKYH
jgi:thiamine kinase-like enzyme